MHNCDSGEGWRGKPTVSRILGLVVGVMDDVARQTFERRKSNKKMNNNNNGLANIVTITIWMTKSVLRLRLCGTQRRQMKTPSHHHHHRQLPLANEYCPDVSR